MTGPREARIEAVAGRQRGRINNRQLREIGVSRWITRRLVDRNLFFPLGAGVFVVGHRAPIPLGDETTALLAADHEHALLCRMSAAALWGMPRGDGAVHVLVPEGTRTRANGYRLHRTRRLTPRDIRIREGLPVTSPALTLLDNAPTYSARELELAFDRVLVANVMRPDDVTELIGRASGRTGVPILRQLAAAHQGSTLTRSQAEECFLELTRGAHLPQPRVNARVAGYEVDFFWPKQRLVVEIDGYRYHSTRRAFEHDRRKEADLRAAGLIVIRFSYEQLRREPLVVVAAVAAALTQVATISAPSSVEMATSTE